MIKIFEQRTVLFYFLFALFIVLTMSVVACSKIQEKSKNKKQTFKIYTSLFVLEHFAKILLPDAEVESLIPAGVDPHHFEPSLKDIQRLYNADMIIYLGDTDVDRWIDKIKDELIQKGVKVIRLQDSLSLKKYTSSDEIDPHVWLDPVLSMEIAKIIKEKASQLSPERKEVIERNFSNYEQKLIELDKAYKETLSNCALKDAISTHEFLNYLASRYGFNSYYIVHEPEDEPSPKKIKKLKDFMKQNSIEYIISEPEGEKIARALSQETGAKTLNFNTYHTSSKKDYLNVMKDNLKVLSIALKCAIKYVK